MAFKEQHLIDKKNIFFELKEIIKKHEIKSVCVICDCDTENLLVLKYMSEMGLNVRVQKHEHIGFDPTNIKHLEKSTDFSGCQLIIVAGSHELINFMKYMRHASDIASIPLIVAPGLISYGNEANGIVLTYDKDECNIVADEKTVPEYVLHDEEFACYDGSTLVREALAMGICRAVNILWTNDADTEAVKLASDGLRLVIKSITKVMRNDTEGLRNALEGAYLIGKATGVAGLCSMDEGAITLSRATDIGLGEALMKLAAPFAMLAEDYVINKGVFSLDDTAVIPDDIDVRSIYTKIENIARIVASGEPDIRAVSNQMRFIEYVLQLYGKDLKTKEVFSLIESIDNSLFNDWPMKIKDESERRFWLYAYHKETLKEAIDKHQLSIDIGLNPARHKIKINELKKRYRDDLSDDRIIKDQQFRERIKRKKLIDGLQKEVLETLLLSKDFLEKHGLRYYLSEGTLLGAIRHKGFIPWDDDVDIMMPREDYNKLVELDKQGLIPPELHFDALENNPKHWVLGAKLQLTRESAYTQTSVKNLSEYNGPYIDVFPLDYWNSPYSKKQYRSQRMVKMCRRLLFLKTGYSRNLKGKFHRLLMLIAIPFIPNTAIEKFAIKHMTMFNDGTRKYMVHLASYYRFYKEVFPASCYGEPLYREFEGHMFPVPREYDYMLRTIYGNSYDSLPPARVAELRNHPFKVSD